MSLQKQMCSELYQKEDLGVLFCLSKPEKIGKAAGMFERTTLGQYSLIKYTSKGEEGNSSPFEIRYHAIPNNCLMAAKVGELAVYSRTIPFYLKGQVTDPIYRLYVNQFHVSDFCVGNIFAPAVTGGFVNPKVSLANYPKSPIYITLRGLEVTNYSKVIPMKNPYYSNTKVQLCLKLGKSRENAYLLREFEEAVVKQISMEWSTPEHPVQQSHTAIYTKEGSQELFDEYPRLYANWPRFGGNITAIIDHPFDGEHISAPRVHTVYSMNSDDFNAECLESVMDVTLKVDMWAQLRKDGKTRVTENEEVVPRSSIFVGIKYEVVHVNVLRKLTEVFDVRIENNIPVNYHSKKERPEVSSFQSKCTRNE